MGGSYSDLVIQWEVLDYKAVFFVGAQLCQKFLNAVFFHRKLIF